LSRSGKKRKKQPPFLFSQDGKKDGRAGIEHDFEKKPQKNKNGREMARCVREKGER
jgi:hypothetical protein